MTEQALAKALAEIERRGADARAKWVRFGARPSADGNTLTHDNKEQQLGAWNAYNCAASILRDAMRQS